MKNVFKLAAFMTALASTSVFSADLSVQTEPAAVANRGGFYIGSLNSLTFLDDTNFSPGVCGVNTDYGLGYYSTLRVGYSFGSHGAVTPRIELEVGNGRSEVDAHAVAGVSAAAPSRKLRVTSRAMSTVISMFRQALRLHALLQR